MTRDENLFWQHLAILCTTSTTPDISGFHQYRNQNSKTQVTGLAYRDLKDDGCFSPLLRLNYCVFSKGFQVYITTNYEGASEEKQTELDDKIAEFSVLYEKFFAWDGFIFDELIRWISAHSEWDSSADRQNES